MPLDPYVKRFLYMVAAAGIPEVSELTPTKMRQAIVQLARVADAKDIPIGKTENRELPRLGAPLPVRVYIPSAINTHKTAGLVYFHGGAGVFCNIETHDGLCRMLANESGCRVISVDYRLAPEHKFPAAVEDSWLATKWVSDHALELGIDPERIAVGGDSAGGTLAAVVCHLAKQTGTPRLALQVLLCPVTDVSANTSSRKAYAERYFFDQATMEWALKHYCPPGIDLEDPRISPLRALDLAGLPAAQIHTAEFDPLRDEGKAYADRLRRAGVNVSYTCHEGMIHHFYAMAGVIPYARLAMRSAGTAIKEALA
jgi:acetyl esterase/lipase